MRPIMQKRKEVKAPWWLKVIRSEVCLATGCHITSCDPHHILRQRWRDDFVVPLCRQHHSELTDMGEWAWCKKYNCNLYEYLFQRFIPEFDRLEALR